MYSGAQGMSSNRMRICPAGAKRGYNRLPTARDTLPIQRVSRSPRHTKTRITSRANSHRNAPFPARLAGDLHGPRPSTARTRSQRGSHRVSRASRLGTAPPTEANVGRACRPRSTSADLRTNACGRAVLKSDPTRPSRRSEQGLVKQGVKGFQEESC